MNIISLCAEWYRDSDEFTRKWVKGGGNRPSGTPISVKDLMKILPGNCDWIMTFFIGLWS